MSKTLLITRKQIGFVLSDASFKAGTICSLCTKDHETLPVKRDSNTAICYSKGLLYICTSVIKGSYTQNYSIQSVTAIIAASKRKPVPEHRATILQGKRKCPAYSRNLPGST